MTKRGLVHALDFTGRLMVSKSKFADEATAVNSWLQNEALSREPSPEISSLAAKYLGMDLDYFRGHAGLDHNTRELEIVFTDIKRLAASVLSQDVTKGQDK